MWEIAHCFHDPIFPGRQRNWCRHTQWVADQDEYTSEQENFQETLFLTYFISTCTAYHIIYHVQYTYYISIIRCIAIVIMSFSCTPFDPRQQTTSWLLWNCKVCRKRVVAGCSRSSLWNSLPRRCILLAVTLQVMFWRKTGQSQRREGSSSKTNR